MPEHRPGVVGVRRPAVEHEGSDHTEIAAASAYRPEQVLILLVVRGDGGSIGEHHVHRDQVVDGEPVLAREVPKAAAKRQP